MLISTESLKKNINDKCILKDASFTIEDTDKIALIGVNGTGKSTLLKILAGIENYDSGTIIKRMELKFIICHKIQNSKQIVYGMKFNLRILKMSTPSQNLN